MIDLTLDQLLNSIDSLKQLSNKSLKARPAFTVARIIKLADEEINNFNETRYQLINKYGEKNEDGTLNTDSNNNVHIKEDLIENFNSELSELLATNISLAGNKINFRDIENLNFTPNEIIQLEPFIDME